MPQETPPTESSSPKPTPPRALFGARLVILLAVCAALLALVAVRYRGWILDRLRVNHLYHLGHLRQWDEAYKDLGALSLRDADDPYALRIRLEILLHLARTGEALDLIDEHRALFETGGRDLVGLQQTAAFVCILADQNQRALAMLRLHPRHRLSAEMVRLIGAVPAKTEIDARQVDRFDGLIQDEMIFRGPYNDLARYLLARCYLNRGQTDSAIDLLEGICERYPYQATFHYDLAGAYLEKRRFDLATIHFLIAHNEMLRQARQGRTGEGERSLLEDEDEFGLAVFERTLPHSATRTPGDFWRLLRGLAPVLPQSAALKALGVNPHRRSLAGVFEWDAALGEFGAPRDSAATEKTLDPFEDSLRAAMIGLTRERRLVSRSVPIERKGRLADEDGVASYSLRTVSVLAQAVSLLNEGSVWSGGVPAASEKTVDGAVLIRLRAFARRGICGGCRIRVGTDLYWVYPTDVRWYAFPMPPLPGRDLDVEVMATDYAIPGYTEPGDKESRRLHVEAVVGCYLEEGKKQEGQGPKEEGRRKKGNTGAAKTKKQVP